MRKLLVAPLLAVALVTASALPASAWWSKPQPRETIAEKVAASGGTFDRNPFDFDILLNAVQAAGLVDALADPDAELTVFAPNDLAFVLLARDLGYHGWDEAGAWAFLVDALTDLGGGDPIPVLTDVLLYHVAAGERLAIDVIKGRSVDTLLGASFGVRGLRLVDNEPDLRDPYLNLFGVNQRASNGVVHTITRVLVPVDLP